MKLKDDSCSQGGVYHVVLRYLHAASSEYAMHCKKRNKKIQFEQRTEGQRPGETVKDQTTPEKRDTQQVFTQKTLRQEVGHSLYLLDSITSLIITFLTKMCNACYTIQNKTQDG